MVRKHISDRDARSIARTRMEKLMALATKKAIEGDEERSKRYVLLAMSRTRTKTRMLKEHLYCRNCYIALVPGRNCRVRLRNDRVVTHCLVCDAVRRRPYIKEKRGEV